MPASVTLQPGQLFAGEYRVVRLLGEGGMGAVFVAEQLSTGIQRALKLMHPGLVQDPQTLRRFEQEARVGAAIQSDHVVQVVDAGVDQVSGMPWIAMELLDGETLAQALARSGPLSWQDCAEVISQLCHALGAAHRIGVVHRDLKPDNVFLAIPRRQGVHFTVKVLDFGIAKILVEAQNSSATTSIVGTPLWMAPEQAERNLAPSPATDVWSLGLLAFTVLTSKLFWAAAQQNAGTITALLKEMLIDPIPAASARAAQIQCVDRLPAGFDLWFARCTARHPSMRFRDASEACAALERVLPTPASGWPRWSLAPAHSPLPMQVGSYPPDAMAIAATAAGAPPGPSGPGFVFAPHAPPLPYPPALDNTLNRGVAATRSGSPTSSHTGLVVAIVSLLAFLGLVGSVGVFLAFLSGRGRPPKPRPGVSSPAPTSATSSAAQTPDPGLYRMPTLTLSVPPITVPGVSYTGYLMLYRYDGAPVDYAGMWDKGCLVQQMSPCSEELWARACEKEPILAGSPSWTMTVQDGKVVVRGGDSCASRKLVSPSDIDPSRAISCCSPVVPIKAEGLVPQQLAAIAMRVGWLDTVLTKRTPPTKDFLADKVSLFGSRDLDRNQALMRIEKYITTQPRPWISTEGCDVKGDADGATATCRRYVYDSGKLQVMNTRERMQGANFLFREVVDAGVVQSVGR